jgi:transcription elongation factor GreA
LIALGAQHRWGAAIDAAAAQARPAGTPVVRGSCLPVALCAADDTIVKRKVNIIKMTSTPYVSLPRQALIRLTTELADLRRWPSVEVPDDFIDTAENHTGYRARRARIRHIEEVLAQADVDDELSDDGIAGPDMVLTVRYDDSGSTETFILGGYGAGDVDNKIYPLRSPIGRAIAGARPGEHRTLCLPDCPPIAVTLLSAQPATSTGATRYRGRGDSRRRSPADIASKPAHARNHAASTRSLLAVEVA